MTSPPSILTNGAMNSQVSCGSIADGAGNLLFYTNGYTIWNSSHSVMNNGTGLAGSMGSPEVLIAKQPGNSNIYYVFTINGSSIASLTLQYAIVDMNLSAGMGSVTVKNSTVASGFVGAIAATKHCNGQDVWLVVHATYSNSFYSYLLTSTGISTTAVVVTTGPSYLVANSSLKFSSTGRKLAAFHAHNSLSTNVYDFDAASANISSPISIPVFGNLGLEFSPDGSKLYGIGISDLDKFSQFDLCAGSSTAVAASIFTINAPGIDEDFQLAPDGKIYVSRNNQQALGVINSPNNLGAACNYVNLGQSVAPKTCRLGLPDFVTGYHPIPPAFTSSISPNLSCNTASFASPSPTAFGCTASGYTLTGMLWDFGDPTSGTANTSTLSNPSHFYPGPGVYTVKLIMYYTCGGGTDTLIQPVTILAPTLNITTASITCANLGSATVTPASGAGPFSYTWMPTGATGSVATGLSPGTHSLTGVNSGSTCLFTTTVNLLPLVPLTGSVSVTNSVSCPGAATGTGAIVWLAGGSGAQSYAWFNGTTTYSNATTNSLSAGLWSITVTDSLTACKINQAFFITEPASFSLNLSSDTPSICAGSNIVLTGTNSGGTPGYTYTWTNGPPIDTFTISETVSGTYVYTLNSTDANNCLISNTIAVDFIPNPTITVSHVFICPLAVGTLSASGASSYTWALAPFSLTSTPLSQTATWAASPLTDTEYAVVGSALGCTAMATASIILHQVPVPVFNSNSPVCNGQSLLLNGAGGNSYNWTGPSGFSSGLSSPTINPANPSQNGVYNLTVTSIDGCTATTSSTLTVNPTPTLSATGATVCSSQTLNLISNSEPGASYLWSGPLNFNSTLQSPSLSSLTLNHSGSYSVVVTSILGCTNTTHVDVLVVPPPNLTANLSSTLLCTQAFNGSQNTTTLTTGGATTYTLMTVPDMTNLNPGGPVSPLTVIPPYSGPGTATVWGSNGVCTVFTTLTFSIIPNPTVVVSSTPVICAGDNYTYTSQGASSYTWSGATPGFTTYNNGGVAVAHPSINSVFSVVGGSLGCFSATKTSTITVNPLPKILISPNQPTVCLYKSAQLTASGTATAYAWNSAPGLFNGTGPSVSVSPLSQQVYTVTGELDNCFASVTTTVDVRSLPEPIINTSKDTYCENESITLSGEGGLVYEWRGPLNIYYQKQVISSQVGSGSQQLAGGIYSLTVTDGNGCQATTTKLITIHELPEGSLLGYKESGCVPLCAEYNFKTNGSNSFSSWTVNHQTFGEKFKYCFSEPGTFTISGSVNDGSTGCENHLAFVVTVYPKPEANFNYLPLHPVEGLDEVNFTNTSIAENQKKWNWYFMNNSGYQSTDENTSYLFSAPGEYPVAFVVTDQNYCQDTAVKVIKVEPDFTLYIPDAFTPNGDGLNDVFLPVVRSSSLFTLSVFDRWGNRIFYSTSPQSGWNGSFHEAECKVDVYNYQIILSTVSGEKKEYSGHVSLVR